MRVKDQNYDKDFYAWTMHNAELLRQGRFSELDIENIAEELESMGKGNRRELINRFAILIAHLLKWHYQPVIRSRSWQYTIKEQRMSIHDLLEESPSLNHEVEEQFSHAYEKALVIGAKETGMEEKKFPKKCPYTLNQCLDYNFLPE